MPGEKEEPWFDLSRKAALESDADRLADIVDQINRMLYEKEQRLKEERQQNPGAV